MAKARISSNWGAGETVKGRQAANALGVLPLAFFLMGLGCFFYDGDSTLGKFPSWKYLLPLLSGAALEFWAHLRFVRIPVFPELKARIFAQGMLAVSLLWLAALAGWFGAFFYGGMDVDLMCMPPIALRFLWLIPFFLFLTTLARLTQNRLAVVTEWGILTGFFGGIIFTFVTQNEMLLIAGFCLSVFCFSVLLPLVLSRSLRRFAAECEAEPAAGEESISDGMKTAETQTENVETENVETEAGKTESPRLSELSPAEIRGLKRVFRGILFLLASAVCALWCALTFYAGNDSEFAQKLACWGLPGAYLLLLVGGSFLCAAPERFRMKFLYTLLFGILLAAAAECAGLVLAVNGTGEEARNWADLLISGSCIFFLVSFLFCVRQLLGLAEKLTTGEESVLYGNCRELLDGGSFAAVAFILFGLAVMKVGPVFSIIALLLWGKIVIGMLLAVLDVLRRFLNGESET